MSPPDQDRRRERVRRVQSHRPDVRVTYQPSSSTTEDLVELLVELLDARRGATGVDR